MKEMNRKHCRGQHVMRHFVRSFTEIVGPCFMDMNLCNCNLDQLSVILFVKVV